MKSYFLFQATSLVSIIPLMDLTVYTRVIAARTFYICEMYITAGLLYLYVTYGILYVFKRSSTVGAPTCTNDNGIEMSLPRQGNTLQLRVSPAIKGRISASPST